MRPCSKDSCHLTILLPFAGTVAQSYSWESEKATVIIYGRLFGRYQSSRGLEPLPLIVKAQDSHVGPFFWYRFGAHDALSDEADAVLHAIDGYPVRSVLLFGSYASGAQDELSDVDPIVEFSTQAVSLLTLSALRLRLEETLGVSVDLIHGPIPEGSLLDIGRTVELCAA